VKKLDSVEEVAPFSIIRYLFMHVALHSNLSLKLLDFLVVDTTEEHTNEIQSRSTL
jgi:hypothetical protein